MKDTNPNPFDTQIRQSLEGFEMPYNPAAWTQFEAMMPKQPVPSTGNAGWLKGAAVVALVAAIGAVTYTLWPNQPVAVVAPIVAPQEEVTTLDASIITPEVVATSAIGSNQGNVTPSETSASPQREASETAVPQEERTVAAVSANPPSTTERKTITEQNNAPSPIKKENAPQAEINLMLKVSKTAVCLGEQVSFMPVAGTGGLRYAWNFGDGEQSTKAEPVRTYEQAGTYEVKLTATKEGHSWERTETIEVMPAPDARITGAENMKGALPLYTLKTELQAGESCTWTFGDGRKATESEVRHLFRKRDAAAVTLTVTNGQGCSATEKLNIPMAKDFNLFAQTAFTPNGDVNNEVFVPKALEAMECDFEMIIRDAKGTIVFRTSSVDHPWDGRDLGGVVQPKGLYFWTVVLKDAILQDRVFTGDITLM